jgi:hypothetical protein
MMRPMQEVLELRREYPIESLRHRLAYEHRAIVAAETKRDAVATSQKGGAPAAVPAAQSKSANRRQGERLSQLEDRLARASHLDGRAFRYRQMALQRLYHAHQSAVDEFVNSPGFGVGRMGNLATPTRAHIEMPPASPIPQPQAVPYATLPSSDEEAAQPQSVVAGPDDPSPMQKALSDMHLEGAANFANPLGFGYVHDLDHTIGFQPHAFSQLPQMSQADGEATRWKIGKLELVSLLRHDEPRVYQSTNLPNMQELEAVPTRALDDFESAALGKLRDGDDLIASSGRTEIRMLGSLRAASQCLDCHHVDRGDLLGAFTYRLHNDTPVESPEVEKAPRKPAS